MPTLGVNIKVRQAGRMLKGIDFTNVLSREVLQVVSELLDYLTSGPFLDRDVIRIKRVAPARATLMSPVVSPCARRGEPLYERFLDKLSSERTVQSLGGEKINVPFQRRIR